MVTCPRRAYYQFVGQEKETRDEWVTNLFGIRSLIGEAYQAKFFQKGYEVEVPVEWPKKQGRVGTGHIDLISPERDIIELKTSTQLELNRYAMLQVTGYWMALPKSKKRDACVWLLDPSLGREEHITLGGQEFLQLKDEVKGLFHVARGFKARSRPPQRAGTHPGDDPCGFCEFREHCWSTWEPPHPDELLWDESMIHKIMELTEQLQSKSCSKSDDKSIRAERQELLDKIRPDMAYDEWYEQHGVSIKVSKSPGRKSFDIDKARAAGWEDPEQFVKQGEPSERWTVKRVE